MHALGLEFGSAAQLSKRPGSVWNCLWGNALKRSPGIIRKSRVLYPGPGFLSSATWPSLPKKHYDGLNQPNLWRLFSTPHIKLQNQLLVFQWGILSVEGFTFHAQDSPISNTQSVECWVSVISLGPGLAPAKTCHAFSPARRRLHDRPFS